MMRGPAGPGPPWASLNPPARAWVFSANQLPALHLTKYFE